MPANELEGDNLKLVESFGAERIEKLKDKPDFRAFQNGLLYSHRDFDKFYEKLKKKEKCAIVSGFNASGNVHVGHLGLFDTNLFFQKEYGLQVFIPISDDESYVSLKVKTQEEGLKNSLVLAKSMIAYGYDLSKTHLIIDQLYTNIYNLAIKLSRGITMSEIKAIYGYKQEQNVGLHFYPAIQSAHILFPQTMGIPNVLVPIGPDEDSHLRSCRDVADKFGFLKPAVLHSRFLPGLDGEKMSKSRGNAVFLLDDDKVIKKRVFSAFSGGQASIEEHRKLGGNPDVDVAYLYLKSYFLNDKDSKQVYDDYKKGKILSGEMKTMLHDKISERIAAFKSRYEKVSVKDLEKVVLTNEPVDVKALADKLGIFS